MSIGIFRLLAENNMPVHRITMTQFRNYQHNTFSFIPKMNILYGPNGSGKTTVLEAVHCLTLARSFKSSTDKNLVQRETDFYQIEGEFFREDDSDVIQLNYVKNRGKKLFVNKIEQEKLSAIIGRYPVVTLAPEDSEITFGPPTNRRSYFDKVMSQTSGEHLKLLIQLQGVLKQRNAILQDAADRLDNLIDETLMSVYDDQLIEIATKIEKARLGFFEKFRTIFNRIYQELTENQRFGQIRFSPTVPFQDNEQFDKEFREALDRRRNQEIAFRRTMVGPQSDVIEFYLDENPLRDYGSQGEHKLFLVALKLAEGKYILEKSGRTPIYLLDDLFAELDIERSRQIIEVLGDRGQILITSTDLSDVRYHGIEIDGEDIQVLDVARVHNQEASA